MKLLNIQFNKIFIKIFLITCVVISTSGCSNRLKEKLGFIEHGPDEFTVVAYPELIVPDNFDLPKPRPITYQTKHVNHNDHSYQNYDVIDFDKEEMDLDESDQIFLQQFN